MTISEITKEYTCHYGHRFIGRDAKLIHFKNDSEELVGCVMFVKSDDSKLYKGGTPKEGYLLACPHCGVIQLGGFTCPGDKQLDSKLDMVVKRNIVLTL